MKCLILFSCVLALACGHPQGIVNDPNVRQQIDNTPFRLKDSINSFDQKIFSKLAGYEQGNIVYSPFSLHMLLSQAYAGAPTGTPTSQELANLLALKPEYNRDYLYNFLKVLDSQSQLSKEPGTTVEIANKLYVAKDLTVKQPFKQALQTFYNSDIQSVDFKNPEATVDIINKFVNDKTKGLIDKILEADSLDGLSRMVMVNAIYFKGEWKNQFEPEDTQNYKFNVDKNRQVDAQGMKMTRKLFVTKVDEIGANVLELPYKNEQLAMIIVLPNPDTDVRQVQAKLQTYDVSKINEKLEQTGASEVDLTLPKFETSFEWTNLEEDLKSLGVKTVFDAKNSNLSDISNEPLYVSKVVHKAIIKVNEEGSEAAAVSGAVIATRNEFVSRKVEFTVDRPFLFFIYNKADDFPLFAGRIVDPNGKENL